MLFSFYILISYMFFILQDFQGLWAKDCTTSLSWGGLNHICWNCTILCGVCNSLGCVSACFICLDRPRYPRKINLLPILFCFYSLPPSLSLPLPLPLPLPLTPSPSPSPSPSLAMFSSLVLDITFYTFLQ